MWSGCGQGRRPCLVPDLRAEASVSHRRVGRSLRGFPRHPDPCCSGCVGRLAPEGRLPALAPLARGLAVSVLIGNKPYQCLSGGLAEPDSDGLHPYLSNETTGEAINPGKLKHRHPLNRNPCVLQPLSGQGRGQELDEAPEEDVPPGPHTGLSWGPPVSRGPVPRALPAP